METAMIEAQTVKRFSRNEKIELELVADAAVAEGGVLFTGKLSAACKAFRDMAIQVYVDLAETSVVYADLVREFQSDFHWPAP